MNKRILTTMLVCLSILNVQAQQLVSSIASNEGGSISLQNPLKVHPAASNWVVYNMTGGYTNSLQFWAYTNTTNLGPKLILSDAGDATFTGSLNVGAAMSATSTITSGGYLISSINNNEGGAIGLLNPSKTAPDVASRWQIYNMTGGYGNSLQFWAYSNTENLGPKLTITDAGNVGIGTNAPAAKLEVAGNVRIGTVTMPGGYRLYVEQGILTEKVKVALKSSANWADHVFAPGYQLPPLSEVETFVKKNGHLPGIPSADALVKEGGVDVNNMFARQLEKIEELTLYIIEIKKEIAQLRQVNTQLLSNQSPSKK